jgi:hypothetical protein
MMYPWQGLTAQALHSAILAAALLTLAALPASVAGAAPAPAQIADDGSIAISFTDGDTLAWSSTQVFQRYDVYRGDLELLRSGGVYTQDPGMTPAAARFCDQTAPWVVDTYVPPIGKVAFYFVTGWNDGIEWSLGADSAGRLRPNNHPCPCGRPFARVLHTLTDETTAQRRMIDNLADWCAFLPSECGSGLIDFATEVALISARVGADTCFDTLITCVENAASAEAVTVYVEDIDPGTCVCFPIVTFPVDVVKIPRPLTSAAFVATTVPRICP